MHRHHVRQLRNSTHYITRRYRNQVQDRLRGRKRSSQKESWSQLPPHSNSRVFAPAETEPARYAPGLGIISLLHPNYRFKEHGFDVYRTIPIGWEFVR